jgi:hypothetical protein
MFFSSVQLTCILRFLPAVASIYPCAQHKTCQTCFTGWEFNVSSVNLDGGYMKRSFVCSQWFLLSSETTASRVGGGGGGQPPQTPSCSAKLNLVCKNGPKRKSGKKPCHVVFIFQLLAPSDCMNFFRHFCLVLIFFCSFPLTPIQFLMVCNVCIIYIIIIASYS